MGCDRHQRQVRRPSRRSLIQRAFRQILSEGAHKPAADWSLVERALAVTDSFQSDAATASP